MSDVGEGSDPVENVAHEYMEIIPQPEYMEIIPQQPDQLYKVHHDFAASGLKPTPNTNFLKGVKWSPDGCCVLTASDDNWFRLFDLPPDAMERGATAPSHLGVKCDDNLSPGLRVCEGECVYDYAWYPSMTATDPVTCVFASTTRSRPIHLWDALSGALRATYRGYNELDEVAPAHSLAFAPGGARLAAGYRKMLLLFDVSRPGREYDTVPLGRRGSGTELLNGIVSCLAYSPDGAVLAAGSYSGSIGLFDARTNSSAALLSGQQTGGVTQVQFTPDSLYLVSGARQDSALLVWDARSTGEVLYRLERDTAHTNQRIYFDLEPCGRHLITGGAGGKVQMFDLRTGSMAFAASVSADTVNGVSLHPFLPLMATASGHRRYPFSVKRKRSSRCTPGAGASTSTLSSSSDEDDDSDCDERHPDGQVTISRNEQLPLDGMHNAFGIWKMPHHLVSYTEASGQDGQVV